MSAHDRATSVLDFNQDRSRVCGATGLKSGPSPSTWIAGVAAFQRTRAAEPVGIAVENATSPQAYPIGSAQASLSLSRVERL